MSLQLFVLTLGLLGQAPPAPHAAVVAAPSLRLEDAAAAALMMNSAKNPLPSAEFGAGTVSSEVETPHSLVKNGSGFTIKMASESPIPTPTVYRKKLFVSGGFSSREFHCFDAVSGAKLWSAALSDDGPTAAVPYDDTIIFNTESCTIFALDIETGKLRWGHYLGDPMMAAPTVADGLVFTSYPAEPEANDDEAAKAPATPKPGTLRPTYNLACFDAKTGKLVWRRWLDGDCISAPVAYGGDVWTATLPGTLYRFHAADGKFAGAWHARATSAPAVTAASVFLTCRNDDPKTEKSPREALVAMQRKVPAVQYLALDRPAAYLDSAVQAISEATQDADKFEGKNGIPGGFGGGFFGVADDLKSTEDKKQSPAPSQTDAPAPKVKQAPAATKPDSATKPAAPAETEKPAAQKPITADMPPPDALAAQQRLAAGNFGLGNVSTIQAYQGSRIVNVGERNFNCMGDELVCSSTATGARLWKLNLEGDAKKLGGHLGAPPVVAEGDLFVALVIGDVIRVDMRTGMVKSRFEIGSTLRYQPVVEAGRLYVTTQDGKVVCRKLVQED